MDPNETLKQILNRTSELITEIDELSDTEPVANIVDDVSELADLIVALDSWICNGGFLPERWAAAQNRNNTETPSN